MAGEVLLDQLLDAVVRVRREALEPDAEAGREAVDRVLLARVEPAHDAIDRYVAGLLGELKAAMHELSQLRHRLPRRGDHRRAFRSGRLAAPATALRRLGGQRHVVPGDVGSEDVDV